LSAVALAMLLVILEPLGDLHLVERWPLFFGASPASASGLLTTVASSMITVAGVVFSITLVALSLTASQYTSRLIRNFMRDRVNQVVLGVFVGIFAYCLVVLRTIREEGDGSFVPTLAVLGGLVLAFVGIGMLIYFIHHIVTSIQASSLIATTAEETLSAVDELIPEELDENDDEDANGSPADVLMLQPCSAVPARKTGYIVTVDTDALLELARKEETVLRMERSIGEFVAAGTPLISIMGFDDVDEAMTDTLNAVYVINRQRTLEQDATFGIRQIVDIALKALSPGINDTSTAIMCVDYLMAILCRLAGRRIATPSRSDRGEVRVIVRGPTFEGLLSVAFDQIRQHADGNVAILLRILGAIHTIAGQTTSPSRRSALGQTVDEIAEAAERGVASPYDRERLTERLALVRAALEMKPADCRDSLSGRG
ncbi:DUF2254 domain-containing protein, partial [Thiocapsa sp.]|uniref:DUF2254 domain-containing protein n=1 Tax=Thiocapsa sp. TaxID=2024551 RepID=UPI0025D62A06